MNETVIFVRAYCGNFEVSVLRKEFLSVSEAEAHVRREVINTAMVVSVVHKKPDGDVCIENERYKDPSVIIVSKKIKNETKPKDDKKI